jgi:hypothetical protein
MIVEIIALVIFAVVIVHTFRAVTQWAKAYLETKAACFVLHIKQELTKFTETKLDQVVVGLDSRFNHEFPKFCADTKADLHQTIENMLANRTEKPDNAEQQNDQAAGPPFWKNREKLEAAMAAIKQGEFDADAPDFGGMPQLETARAIDAALLDLLEANSEDDTTTP